MSSQEGSPRSSHGATTTATTGSPQLMRRMNREQVLTTLRDFGPMTRPAISKATGLSKITVDAVATELLLEERVAEAPEPPTGSPGRRARLLSFRDDSAHVAAIDIGATRAKIGIADLSGTFVAQESVDLTGSETGAEIVDAVRASLRRAVGAAGLTLDEIRALCIATPGIVDPATQRVTLAPQLPDWDDIDLVAEMSFIGDAPIHIENEVHLAVVGEQWRGAARGSDDIAYVHLGVGVGLGIVKGSALIRGAHGGAGEIGYLPLIGIRGEDYPGTTGRFEWLVGGGAYQRAARDLVAGGGGTALVELAGGSPSRIDAALIYHAAEKGDPDAAAIVDHILTYTAAGIASVVAILDPGLVIIGGGISQAGQFMLSRLDERVRALVPLAPDLALAGLGNDAALFGATRRAIEACEHELIDLTR